jgi:hypothetical protein
MNSPWEHQLQNNGVNIHSTSSDLLTNHNVNYLHQKSPYKYQSHVRDMTSAYVRLGDVLVP